MRILIIRNYPTKFNIERQTYNIQEIGLAKALIRKGHECDIVFWSNTEDEVKEVVFDGDKKLTVYYFKALRILKNGIFPRRLDKLAETYDVIQCCEYNQYHAWHYAKKFKDKTVILHGPYYSPFNKKYNLLCKVFDLFFLSRYKKLGTQFITKSYLATDFLASKGIDRSLITQAGIGIDKEVLRGVDGNARPLEAIEGGGDEFRLLYIGAMERRRNILFQLELLKHLLDKGLKCRLILVGKPLASEPGYFESCKAYSKENHIDSHVTYIESVPQKDMSRLYPFADVFLFPTEFDIFGMVLLEAMYFGVPVVSTFNGGSATLMNEENSGFVLEGCDVETWSGVIEKLCHHPELRLQIKEKTRAAVEKEFTWDSLCDRFIAGYEKKRKET